MEENEQIEEIKSQVTDSATSDESDDDILIKK